MSDELEKAVEAVIAARAPDGQGREAAVAEAVRLARDVESYRHLLGPQHRPVQS